MESTSQTQQYCLRWNSHRSNLLTYFDELLHNESFTDVILAVEDGATVKCHKMVLAACSKYFQNLFADLPWEQQTVVVLKDVKYSEIQAILDYMYHGEVNVGQEQLAGLLRVAEVLKVKGLVGDNHTHTTDTNRRRIEELFLDDRSGSGSSPPGISTSRAGRTIGHSSRHVTPPPLPPPPQAPLASNMIGTAGPSVDNGGTSSYNPILRSSFDRNTPMHSLPMWPLLSHQATTPSASSHLPHQLPPSSSVLLQQTPPSLLQKSTSSLLGGLYDNGFENSPHKPNKKGSNLSHHDTPILRGVLGQHHADSSLLHLDSHNGLVPANEPSDRRTNIDVPPSSNRDNEQRSPTYNSTDNSTLEEDERLPSPQSFPGDSKSSINQSTTSKPEWKRYKQYTSHDILSAIEAVRRGTSALRAARTYGVPSRTLYDKVKKLGISTPRPFRRGFFGGNNSRSRASFPTGIGANVNGSIYVSNARINAALSEGETDNNNSNIIIDNTRATDMESNMGTSGGYVKLEQDDFLGDKCNPSSSRQQLSPVEPQQQQQQPDEDMQIEDEVEDLSVSRRTDIRMLVPPTMVMKEETDVIGEHSNRN